VFVRVQTNNVREHACLLETLTSLAVAGPVNDCDAVSLLICTNRKSMDTAI
jgi:hypothetical protein